ncbi:N-terminal Xaa-Pro-Lys N-methyltransferase 1-B-like [Lingula anatina]|uniref:Alpha N-terminal protein methyltransferase 1 n=1 Tax=Lingula anatina TaxID=7574 RepID=A0A1S3HJB4_LINAN|nr:N-terminal Xaa-Pro-Lys N-methyltransferase 1-B-like [Lingula anatina]|eukprot:XP_013386213.1 N-terminal Xaa-Pro-Lys N-methyltransferase 1-B-like [Lingula anatina]
MAEPDTEKFYQDADKYWKEVPATVDGMLGGFAHISNTDINGSTKFLRQFIRGENAKTKSHRALDCGAGIGRITKRLLIPLFDTVDMVELNPDFLNKAREFLGEHADKVEQYIAKGLQDFTPEAGRYDVIWCQWVLGHLTDSHLVEFFKRCKVGLAPDGMLFVKENVTSSDEVDKDDTDSSVTRPRDILVKLMMEAGLKIIKEEKQKGFPKGLYDVIMFALT